MDIKDFKHQLTGIVFTVRYVPSNRPPHPGNVSRDEYKHWRDMWYTNVSGEPFIKDLKPGHVIMIDNAGDGDTGSTGSNNSMTWKSKGACIALLPPFRSNSHTSLENFLCLKSLKHC